ncbi:MAG: hypothetical protein WC712_00125 [Candidatus Brocadiia bacterium]
MVRQKGLRFVERAATEGHQILRFSPVGFDGIIEVPECRSTTDDLRLFRELINELGDEFSL